MHDTFNMLAYSFTHQAAARTRLWTKHAAVVGLLRWQLVGSLLLVLQVEIALDFARGMAYLHSRRQVSGVRIHCIYTGGNGGALLDLGKKRQYVGSARTVLIIRMVNYAYI